MDPSQKLQMLFQRRIFKWQREWFSRESPAWLLCGPRGQHGVVWAGWGTGEDAALGDRVRDKLCQPLCPHPPADLSSSSQGFCRRGDIPLLQKKHGPGSWSDITQREGHSGS